MSHDGTGPQPETQDTVRTNARHILGIRIAELFRYAPVIADPEAVTEMHRARIAARRLRYTLETFDAVFGDEGAQVIAELTALQDVLGQVHDLDVRISLIEDERRALTERGQENQDRDLDASMAILLQRERSDRARLHERVVAEWQLLRERNFRERLVRLSALPLTEHGMTE